MNERACRRPTCEDLRLRHSHEEALHFPHMAAVLRFMPVPSTAFLAPSVSTSAFYTLPASSPFLPTLAPRLAAFSPRPSFSLIRMAGSTSAPESVTVGKSLHDFTVKDINKKDVNLKDYKDKVLLIVNVASQCGLTNSNYTELAQLYEEYKGRDFEILAFPCNQFGSQEPGTNEQIKEFACTRFKAEYPIFDKVDVNGKETAPVYEFLKSHKSGFLYKILGGNIKWNFEKFLIDKKGQVINRYPPTTSPLKIKKDIDKLLDA